MDTQTKTNRAAAMSKFWNARKAYLMAPTCCCGCQERLEIAKNPNRHFSPDAMQHRLRRRMVLVLYSASAPPSLLILRSRI